jgi:hypothetical protein
VSDGADRAAAVALFMTGMSGPVFGALLPGLLAFFVGIGLTVAALVSSLPPLRWPALLYAFGAACIIGEIVSAQVLLSQSGNVVMLVAGIGSARAMLRGETAIS